MHREPAQLANYEPLPPDVSTQGSSRRPRFRGRNCASVLWPVLLSMLVLLAVPCVLLWHWSNGGLHGRTTFGGQMYTMWRAVQDGATRHQQVPRDAHASRQAHITFAGNPTVGRTSTTKGTNVSHSSNVLHGSKSKVAVAELQQAQHAAAKNARHSSKGAARAAVPASRNPSRMLRQLAVTRPSDSDVDSGIVQLD